MKGVLGGVVCVESIRVRVFYLPGSWPSEALFSPTIRLCNRAKAVSIPP